MGCGKGDVARVELPLRLGIQYHEGHKYRLVVMVSVPRRDLLRLAKYAPLAALGLGLAGCVGAPESTTPKLTFWTMQLKPQFTEYFIQLIGEFERLHAPVTVEWVDVPWAEMERKILAAIATDGPQT
ncbi:MAG: hypothetical protein HC919_15340 [Oscillatoriales cyanobacterium SM2_2_1]|nr:hypothetical protein [Oscillatoriales cyanobacterium SM2_2_1]